MKKITTLIQKNKLSIILIWFLFMNIIILAWQSDNFQNEVDKKDLKIKIMQKAIKSAKQPSQIERLWWKAEESRRLTELNLAWIKNLQEKYEFNILTYRCFKDQVNRLMNNKEVDEEFCNNKDNLEKFRLKK